MASVVASNNLETGADFPIGNTARPFDGDVPGMRLMLVGGRHFADEELVNAALTAVHHSLPVSVLIHGGSVGIGAAAEIWAAKAGVNIVRYPPPRTGSRADNVRRDLFMLEDGRPDALLAFPGGRRTQKLTGFALDSGLQVIRAEALLSDPRPVFLTIPA
jgi:hypothetical protein